LPLSDKFAFFEPQTFLLGPDGHFWFAEIYSDLETGHMQLEVGAMATNGQVTNRPLVGQQTLTGLAIGPDGHIWLPGPAGALISMASNGTMTRYPLPNPSGQVMEMVNGPKRSLWFSVKGVDALYSITTTGILQTFPFPSSPTSLG
jgi:virginiamycin B lyase